MAIQFFKYRFSVVKCMQAFVCVLLLLAATQPCMAQAGAEVSLEKPEQYENRKLAAEKTGEKKFSLPRRLKQNLTTHYNYYFNANNRLNEVVGRAKAAWQDDYTQLLSFYNYTLEATAAEKSELDSVIYKATAGILLHDLRSDWVDNMYMLMGKAFLFRNDLDSANMTFQYINYAFAPKEEGGYDIPIGSNASNETGEFSIATNEDKRSIVKKVFGRPPSRNNSFVWQARTFIEAGELAEAAGLIQILRNDPNFPDRLQTDLDEVTAYWFYKQNIYDSSAFYLSRALDEAENKSEQARWEYLIGQMYQQTGNAEQAEKYFKNSIKHTTDPIMDVHARLNLLRLNTSDDKNYVQRNIDELLKMARRDKYEKYRDIIYYAAASIELDRKNYDAAQELLLKSVQYTTNNPRQRSQAFLTLADMNYDRKKYTFASNFYDSTDINLLKTEEEKDRVTTRKPPLKIIATNEATVFGQDSLQALATLAPAKRDAAIKAKLKELRKIKGIKAEDDQTSSNPAIPNQQAPDLFGDKSKSGDFYFYNPSLKSRGFSEFKAQWGQRPNVDNWRRLSAVNQQIPTNPDMNITDVPTAEPQTGPTELSYESLLGNVPLTEEKLAASNSDIEKALNTLGETFLSKLEDYPSAINAYEELLRRFPQSEFRDKALFNLVYAYTKTGDLEKSAAYKKQLLNASDTSKYAQLIKNPKSAQQEDLAKSPETRKYEQIYNMFIEGDFERAKAEKKTADSLYGKSYWTPQLLYIESIYYVTQREDSTAINVLTDLSNTFATSPMAEKAKTMIDVLKRRTEIEDYLTRLEVTRDEDTNATPTPNRPRQQPVAVNKPVVAANQPVLKDSVAAPINIPEPEQPSVAPKKSNATVVQVPGKTVDSTRLATLPGNKTTGNQVVIPPAEPLAKTTTLPKDTAVKTQAPIIAKGFEFKPADPHFVVVVLDKVDPVYATEAKNAFNRFNREKFYNKPIEITSVKLDDRFSLVLEGPFSDANAAVDYIDNVRPVTGSRILPWLNADKYSFLVISAQNLDKLKESQDMSGYKQLIQQAFPGKF